MHYVPEELLPKWLGKRFTGVSNSGNPLTDHIDGTLVEVYSIGKEGHIIDSFYAIDDGVRIIPVKDTLIISAYD